MAVESTARIVACEKQRSGAAIEQEMDIQSRFAIATPRRAKQARRAEQDDLLGGDEASAAESGVEASTVSSEAEPLMG